MRYLLTLLALALTLALPADAQRPYYGPNAGGYGPQASGGGGASGPFAISGVTLSSTSFVGGTAYSGTAGYVANGGTVSGQPVMTLSTTGGCAGQGTNNGSFSFSGFTLTGPSTGGPYNICIAATVPGATNSPLGQPFTIVNSSVCTLAAPVLSGNTFTAGATGNAVIGSVTETPTGCSFTGTLTISGTNSGGFLLSTPNSPSNLTCAASCPAAGTYNDFQIVATQAGAVGSPAPLTPSLTGNPAMTINDVYLGSTAGTYTGTFTQGAVANTVIAAVNVGTTPASSFTGTLALSGTDGAKFGLSSTTLPSNLICPTSAACPSQASASVIVTATQAGAGGSPMGKTMTLTGQGYSGVGDAATPGPVGYWSVAAISNAEATAATAKMANVINLSSSATCDLIVAANGGMGVTANCSTGATDNGKATTTFCPSSTACAVITLYNRGSGTMCDLTQSTAASRPTLSLSPVGVAGNGSNQYLSCAPSGGNFFTPPSSYVVAIYPTGAGNQSSGIPFSYMTTTSGQWNGLFSSWYSTNLSFTISAAFNSSFGVSTAASTIPLNTHAAYAAVYTSSTLRQAFLAGVGAPTDSTSIAPTCTSCYTSWGARRLNTVDYYFNGIIHEVAIYSRALSASEASAICHAQYGNGWSDTAC